MTNKSSIEELAKQIDDRELTEKQLNLLASIKFADDRIVALKQELALMITAKRAYALEFKALPLDADDIAEND